MIDFRPFTTFTVLEEKSMAWGIVLGIVLVGFIGLLSQVATFSMANIWLSVLIGAVLGGVLGLIWDKVRGTAS